jgi:hypothetical protein
MPDKVRVAVAFGPLNFRPLLVCCSLLPSACMVHDLTCEVRKDNLVQLFIRLDVTVVGRVQSGIRYPVVVRFDSVNYGGVSTVNFGVDEVKET